MGVLDLAQADQGLALRPQPTEGHDLPVGFSDAFGAAWSEGQLFGQSTAHQHALDQALQDYEAQVRAAGGNPDAELSNRINISGEYTWQDRLAAANAAVQKMAAVRPDLPVQELSEDDLEQRAVAESRQARENYAAMAGQEKTFGGRVGTFLGGAASAGTDPINLVALPVAPEASLGVLASALRWAAIGGISQTAIELAGAPFREEVQPGYAESGEPVLNVATAAGGAALLGGATKMLGNAWTRLKTGQWPQSVRDAGNIVESEANAAAGNPFPGTAGEAVHRTALQSAIDSVVDGRPVEVSDIVTGSVLQDYERRLGPVMDSLSAVHEARNAVEMERSAAQAAAAPELPFEASARQQAAEAAVESFGGQLSGLARDAGFHLAPMDARDLADHISRLPHDAAVQALDDVMLRPNTLRETLPSPTQARAARPLPGDTPVAQVPPEATARMLGSPEHVAALQADVDRARATGDVRIPDGVDAKGEPIYRSVDNAMAEVEGYRTAADHIAACAAPAAEAAE